MRPAIYLAVVSRYHSYLNSCKQLLQEYNGEVPFASYLKKYFAANKKYGSKDRKHISHLCYCYFRLGRTAMNLFIEERITIGLFLCSDQPNKVLDALRPEWNGEVHLPLREKLLIINYSLLVTQVFPWKGALSSGVDHEKFCESFFIQPDVFLRVRPGKLETVLKKLQIADCRLRIFEEHCLSVPAASKIEDILEIDQEVVVQDYNSQKTGDFFKSAIANLKSNINIWDCCAGSGGKSIMAYDINPTIDLTVSDVRETILINLRKRFQKAGIKNYKSIRTDLAIDNSKIKNVKPDVIICDAPCTGSGTWSRTPEQLYFFKENEIERFASLQKKIVSNVISQLKTGGSFIYITCSVFKKENEEVVDFIIENFPLQLQQMELLKGYDKKADSMFVAVLSLPEH